MSEEEVAEVVQRCVKGGAEVVAFIQCEYKDSVLKKIIVHFHNAEGGIVGTFSSKWPSGKEVPKGEKKRETKNRRKNGM